MCTGLLPPGVNPIVVKHIISYIIAYIIYHITLRHVTSRHVMSCHVMSCHVMSCHVMSCHVMSYIVYINWPTKYVTYGVQPCKSQKTSSKGLLDRGSIVVQNLLVEGSQPYLTPELFVYIFMTLWRQLPWRRHANKAMPRSAVSTPLWYFKLPYCSRVVH
jgi:hypothetical protein